MRWLEGFPAHSPALITAASGSVVTYAALQDTVSKVCETLTTPTRPTLALLESTNSFGAIALYLACLKAGIPLILGEARNLNGLAETYTPDRLFLPHGKVASSGYRLLHAPVEDYQVWCQEAADDSLLPNPQLALLLSTSGSTGSAKLVRLSFQNLESNAQAIASYLGLQASERAIQSLPMHYSYGLSLINSHLVTGASVLLTEHSFMRPEFWQDFAAHECTSFAGVPYMYEVLSRLRMSPAVQPSLRYFTQAGGPLKPELMAGYLEAAQKHGKQMVVMYGQTEATARIAYVPPERLAQKLGSIGIPIPGGTLTLEPVDEDLAQGPQPLNEPVLTQLCYQGPNVMLGYAEKREDLAKGDEQQGRLLTGDIAWQDAEGYFYITGRLQRFAKLFGKRISLVDVELALERQFSVPAAVVEHAGVLKVFVECGDTAVAGNARSWVASFLEIPPTAVRATVLAQLPLTGSGKKNYKALAE